MGSKMYVVPALPEPLVIMETEDRLCCLFDVVRTFVIGQITVEELPWVIDV